MFKLEFDDSNHLLAASIGRALLEYGSLGLGALKPAAPSADDGLSDDERDALAIADSLNDGPPADAATTDACPDCGAEWKPGFAGECPYCTDAHTGGVTTAATGATADTRVDTNGVPFNADYCAEAKEPFYASGKDSGKWKRKRNLDAGAYDTWYAEALAAVEPPPKPDEPAEINTAGAFGGNGAATETSTTPTDCGQFMAWVSELQAAKRLTQEQVGAAYTTCNITMTDLFPPNEPESVTKHVAALHAALSAVAAQ